MTNPNRSVYERPEVARQYELATWTFAAEDALLAGLAPYIDGAVVLDVGVGGGRTTAKLIDRAGTYIGVDYAEAMVSAARRRCPRADIRVADARDLVDFPANHFDFVFFSFNGLDYLDPQDRLLALAEFRRVLRPGGRLLFSSHNRDWTDARKLEVRWRLPYKRRHLRELRGSLTTACNRWRRRHEEEETGAYALVTDAAHDGRLLTYYTRPAAQLQQLSDLGFAEPRAFDAEGQLTEGNDSDMMFHYVACKPLGPDLDTAGASRARPSDDRAPG